MKLFLSLTLLCLILFAGCDNQQSTETQQNSMINDFLLKNPSDIIPFQGKYVATEIYENRLALFESLDSSKAIYLHEDRNGIHFRSPHNLAISPSGTLLVSNGWGNSIVEIDDINDREWKEFKGIDKQFNAPHGICSHDGWIYVADSLNSRVVRFKDMEGTSWEVFGDIDKKISYVRQIYCDSGGLWLANSYEKRVGLNKGDGANILQINDFRSGKAKELVKINSNSSTGVMRKNNSLLFSVFHGYPNIAISDLENNNIEQINQFPIQLGIPYTIRFDQDRSSFLIAFFGSLENQGKENYGGIGELKIAY